MRRKKIGGLGPGVSPRERIVWLLKSFVYQDLTQEEAEAERFHQLRLFLAAIPDPVLVPEAPGPRGTLLIAQRDLRTLFEALAGAETYSQGSPSGTLTVELREPLHPSPGQRLVLWRTLETSLPDALVLGVIEVLRAVPLHLLRRCPYEEHGQRCGRCFLGRKRQKWCEDHQAVVRQRQLREAQETFRSRRRARRRPRRDIGPGPQ